MQSLSKFMLEKVMGWKVVNRFPTELKKYIIIVAPHTSWVDFPVGVFVNYSEKLGANYIAKHTLFKPPFGFIKIIPFYITESIVFLSDSDWRTTFFFSIVFMISYSDALDDDEELLLDDPSSVPKTFDFWNFQVPAPDK